MKALTTLLHVGFIFTASLHAKSLHVENLHVKENNETIKSLTLSQPNQPLLKDTNITLHVKDDKGKEIKKDITWIVKPPYTIRQNSTNVIVPLKDTNIKLKAKYKNVFSNEINLHVKWIVNGHTLPPMPDEKINNSTLLGIDINNNGVRDDVERWIYETYKHPIERGLFMQIARAHQHILISDPKNALETKKKYSDPMSSCMNYWKRSAKKNNESFVADRYRNYYREIRSIKLNTAKRYIAYDRYLRALSGNVWSLKPRLKSNCEFDDDGNLR